LNRHPVPVQFISSANRRMNPCVIPKLSEDHDGDERKLSMHKRFVQQARTCESEILFIGDSIIEQLQFSTLWQEKISSLHCVNFGIGGDRYTPTLDSHPLTLILQGRKRPLADPERRTRLQRETESRGPLRRHQQHRLHPARDLRGHLGDHQGDQAQVGQHRHNPAGESVTELFRVSAGFCRRCCPEDSIPTLIGRGTTTSIPS
jgi:hypothetical protein